MSMNSENTSNNKSNKIRLVEPDEQRINGNNKKKKSLFSKFLLTYSIIIFLLWTSFTIVSNIIIQITLIKNNNKRIESSLNNISIILGNTDDKKIISRFILNQIQTDSDIIGVLKSDKTGIINNNKYTQSELIKFAENDKIIDEINFNTYIYILLKIIKNEYIFKSLGYHDAVIFSGYKPHDLNNNFPLLYLIVSFSLSILGFLISLFLATYYLKFIIFLPIKDLLRKTHFTKQGNLTIDFSTTKKDEIGILSNSMNSVTGTLQHLAKKVYMTVIIMTKILRKLYRSSKKVSDSANAQSLTIEQTLGNFANLNSMIKIITEESTRGTKYTAQAFENSKIGMESIRNLEIEMNKIESSSQEITDIIRIINDIAEQTELLSLNASIESARAGEAGRGFNVVAGEVRKLAEKTTQAANRVYDLITNNNSLIRTGVTYTKDATQVLKEIAISNELSASVVNTISEEIQKVKQSSNEILGVINYISEVTQANLIESDHVSDTTSDLSSQAISLQKLIEKFDFRDDKTKKNIENIKKLLKNKLVIVNDFLKQYGTGILPTGNTIMIKTEDKEYSVREIKFGEITLTDNMKFADMISKKTNSFVTFFQRFEERLISTATTIRYYDNSRSQGKFIKPGTEIYKKIIKGETYYGRVFIVNRWYIAVYKPILDNTGYVQAVISIGLPEETSIDLKIAIENDNYEDGIIIDHSFKHNY